MSQSHNYEVYFPVFETSVTVQEWHGVLEVSGADIPTAVGHLEYPEVRLSETELRKGMEKESGSRREVFQN
jgi:hypothetical protein